MSLAIDGLVKRFGPVTALDGLQLEVPEAHVFGFLGSNGAGKTTTMRILTGYMPATEGKAIVAGFDVFDQPIEAKRRIGYLPETPPLYPDMSVIEYLAFVAKIKGVPAAERRQRVQHVMDRVRVTDMADRLCGRLSKGYRQRVGLAQAIIHNPDVLVLDEPTAGVDVELRQELWRYIRRLHSQGTTIVLTTHYLEEADEYADRVLLMAHGRIVADGPPHEVKAIVGARTIRATLPGVPAERLAGLPGVTRAERRGDTVVLVEHGYRRAR